MKHIQKGSAIPLAASVDGRNGLPKVIMPDAAFFVDGELQDRVTAYSIPDSWICRYKTDERGDLVIDREADCLIDETLHGKVEVVWK